MFYFILFYCILFGLILFYCILFYLSFVFTIRYIERDYQRQTVLGEHSVLYVISSRDGIYCAFSVQSLADGSTTYKAQTPSLGADGIPGTFCLIEGKTGTCEVSDILGFTSFISVYIYKW